MDIFIRRKEPRRLSSRFLCIFGACCYNARMRDRDQDYILDLSSVSRKSSEESGKEDPSKNTKAGGQSVNRYGVAGGCEGKVPAANRERGENKNWIAIKWNCCGAYSRVYKNRAGDAYEGRCPKCMKPVRLRIGEGGTSARFFEAN